MFKFTDSKGTEYFFSFEKMNLIRIQTSSFRGSQTILPGNLEDSNMWSLVHSDWSEEFRYYLSKFIKNKAFA